MTIFEDLKPFSYFGRWQDVLLGVGWLGVDHPYPRGPVSKEFFGALMRLLVDPWQPLVLAGRATCPFCAFSGGPGSLTYSGMTVTLGSANLLVPATGMHVFVAPSMIVHYIDAHEYCPPAVYREAVLRSPSMKSMGYMKELKTRGILVEK